MEMGHGRAGDRTLGFFAVKAGLRVLLAGALAAGLAGCSSIGGFTGAAAGIATGAATTNPAVGIAVGVGVQAATDAVVAKVFRDMQHDEQALIAASAGAMQVGERRAWAVHHTFSFGDEHGEVMVLREIPNALAPCREVALSVAGGKKDAPTSQWFVTQVCQAGEAWAWAGAEPAVERWGTLQ
jgi:hypothetical protein